jgi:hypothetical protein
MPAPTAGLCAISLLIIEMKVNNNNEKPTHQKKQR